MVETATALLDSTEQNTSESTLNTDNRHCTLHRNLRMNGVWPVLKNIFLIQWQSAL